MSAVIKGMIPKTCRVCAICRFYSVTGETVCALTHAILAENYMPIVFDDRHEECPLVELPERHGRLIDADAFAEHLRESAEELGKFAPQMAMTLEAAIRDLKDPKKTPTIVEAEGKEEKK